MSITIHRYSNGEVNAAGATLINLSSTTDELESALNIINDWRALHSFPLNTFQKTLRRKAKAVDAQSLVAQRIKRLSSIAAKLERYPRMSLSRMQDIGGCRAVVSSVAHVNILVRHYERSDIKHRIIRRDNYIITLKPSGYRGVHIVYRYFSDRLTTYNGLKVEMQFRSQLQHAWATAVETVGTFTRQSLKSSQGEQDWLRFFALMGTEIAFREGSPGVPDTPTDREDLKAELQEYTTRLNVTNRLRTFGAALRTLEPARIPRTAHYFLLVLDPAANSITVTSYRYDQLDRASSDYLNAERTSRQRGTDAVLVSVESMDSLRRAYPNYFLDTTMFVRAVEQATE